MGRKGQRAGGDIGLIWSVAKGHWLCLQRGKGRLPGARLGTSKGRGDWKGAWVSGAGERLEGDGLSLHLARGNSDILLVDLARTSSSLGIE